MRKTERTYYPSGRLKKEYQTLDKVKHGRSITYFESGRVYIESRYENGEPHGEHKEWYENGQLAEVGEYIHGEYHVQSFWLQDGTQLLKEGTGKAIRKFGASQGDIYEQYFEKGKFLGEKKIAGVIYGEFIPKKDEDNGS